MEKISDNTFKLCSDMFGFHHNKMCACKSITLATTNMKFTPADLHHVIGKKVIGRLNASNYCNSINNPLLNSL